MTITSAAELQNSVENMLAGQKVSYAEKYPKDVERALLCEGESSHAYVERVGQDLRDEGKPGSAQFLEVFHTVSLAVTERDAVFNALIQNEPINFPEGSSVVIDMEHTTKESLLRNEVILTEGAAEDLLIGANGLAYYIDRHTSRVRNEKVSAFVEEFTRPKTIVENARTLLRFGKSSSERSLYFDPETSAELTATMSDKFINEEDAANTLRTKLTILARNKPRIVGLEASSGVAKSVKELSLKMGGGKSPSEAPLNISDLDTLRAIMPAHAMDELGIYPGYADSITTAIKRELEVN